jgi:hypothetical protein
VLAVKEKSRRRFVKALRRDEGFRADVRHELLTAEIINLSQAVAELVAAVASVVGGDGEQRRQLAHIRSGIAAVEGTLRNGFATLNDMDSDKVERLGLIRNRVTTGFAQTTARFDQIQAETREIKRHVAPDK